MERSRAGQGIDQVHAPVELAAAAVEAIDQSPAHAGSLSRAAQDHGASAEPCARQPSTDGARFHRGFHQPIQRRAAHPQAIVQAGVGWVMKQFDFDVAPNLEKAAPQAGQLKS